MTGLWRNADFVRLWTAGTTSVFGSMLTGMVLPWVAILVLEAPAAPIALLATFRFLPHFLFGLVAGTWADRLSRRPLMIAADLGRAALMAAIPLLYVVDLLSMPALYAVVFASATLTVLFQVAERAYLPTVVARDELIDGNSKIEGGAAAAEAAGFAASGWLARLLTPPFALLVDTATFLVSAAFLSRIRVPETRPPKSETHVLREMREGLDEILHTRPLPAIAQSQALLGVARGLFMALYMIYVVRELGFGVEAIGVIAATGAVGSFLGAWLAPAAARRFGIGPSMVAALVASGVMFSLIPLAPDAALVGALCLLGHQLLGDAVETSWEIGQMSVRQGVVRQDRLARVNGAMQVVESGAMLVGTLAAWALADAVLDVRTLLWIAAGCGVAAGLNLLLSPTRSLREIPLPRTGSGL